MNDTSSIVAVGIQREIRFTGEIPGLPYSSAFPQDCSGSAVVRPPAGAVSQAASGALKASTAFNPPKANEFERAYSAF